MKLMLFHRGVVDEAGAFSAPTGAFIVFNRYTGKGIHQYLRGWVLMVNWPLLLPWKTTRLVNLDLNAGWYICRFASLVVHFNHNGNFDSPPSTLLSWEPIPMWMIRRIHA